MTNYQITIGFKAVIQLDIKAEDDKSAKELALKKMDAIRKKIESNSICVADSNYKVDGVLNMDETWNMVQN